MSKQRDLKDAASQVEAAAAASKPEVLQQIKVSRRNLLSTGSTLLNLALSENPFGGLLKGKYYFLVGDSQSGKTFLSMTCFAEATTNRHFAGYDLIYDNVEDGCLIDLDALFNEAVADRVRPPAMTKDKEPIYSSTIEEFYFHLDDAVRAGKPFIYVLDSMDALDSEAAGKKFDQHKKAFSKRRAKLLQNAEEGGDAASEEEGKLSGSYSDGKAKKNSEFLRRCLKGLRESGSILLVVSQTRDNIGSSYGGKTRSGGRALRFYATAEVWSSVAGVIRKTVNGKPRKIGTKIRLEVKKNRVTGKLPDVHTEIYPSYGIDDIGSTIDFLVEEGRWPVRKLTIDAVDLKLSGTKEKLVRLVESKGLEAELRVAAGRCWKDIEEACSLKRKKRYDVGAD